MKWDEFKDLLSGIGPDTPLGRIVSIRAEDDPDILEHFGPEQKRIRNEWLKKQASEISEEQLNDYLDTMKQAFISLAGGDNN